MSSNSSSQGGKQSQNEETSSLTERRNRNSKQPINRLPDEILARIFLVTTGVSIRPRGAYRFTLFPDVAIQVCSRWMNVALASPTLWTHIHVREHLDDDDVALWVSRAGRDALLDIEIDILEPYCGVAFFDITDWTEQEHHVARIFKYFCSLKAGPQRWRSLSLSILQPEPLYKFIQLLNKQPAPNLRHLYVCSEPDWNDDEFDEERPLTNAYYRKGYSLSEHAAPNLRHVEFTHVSWKYVFDRSKPLLSGLTRLQLSAGRVLTSLSNIQKLLSANPNLELLQISAGYAGDYEFDRLPDDQRPNSVRLSSLKSLLLEGGDNISLVWDILSIVDAPSLEKLSLANNGIDDDDVFAVNIFDYIITGQLPGGPSKDPAVTSSNETLFPLLRELDIECLPFSGQRVVDLLVALSQVTHLSISCYEAKASIGRAPQMLPRLEVLSLQCSSSHQHYQEAKDILIQRALDGAPIRVLRVPSNPQPEPGFEEQFPGTVLRIRNDCDSFVMSS